ncbi:uncharacterized protein LOC118263052 [Spodoptera frugiperda]|uniref:Uncharacterized protein LOC118263052 n=1 Tax=Spodoptera frugiperda TaxID=7108 RepID=A0A9R0EG30_SPOFR|nr:uncharacterized protein LOC118263052 [Spodoptera frugiperda]
MKFFIAFAVLIAGISAVPHHDAHSIDFSDERVVAEAIEEAIEGVSQSIRDAGLDPFHIKREDFSYALPVPELFKLDAYIDEVLSTGLSNIKINRLYYSSLFTRLQFDLEMPLIHFSLGGAKSDVVLFNHDLGVSASGSVDVERIRVVGEIDLYIGIITGVTVQKVDISFTLNDIKSDANLVIFGEDYSDDFNNYVGGVVPDTIKAHYNEINELFEIVITDILKENL